MPSTLLDAHVQERLLYRLKLAIKTLLLLDKSREQKWKQQRLTLRQEVSLPGFYFCYWKLFGWERLHRLQCLQIEHRIPLLLRKEVLLDGFPSVRFVVDMERCRDAYFLCVFAYHNGADSNTKLQHIIIAF